jgi:hypothetical protein
MNTSKVCSRFNLIQSNPKPTHRIASLTISEIFQIDDDKNINNIESMLQYLLEELYVFIFINLSSFFFFLSLLLLLLLLKTIFK